MVDDIVPSENIRNRIYFIRGQRVMLDRDLAELYGVETRRLNEQVKRNITRFPEDFVFSLTREEIMRISQIATSLKFSKTVYAFTEQGVATLSGVLNSQRAIEINIQIMRAFVAMRHYLIEKNELEKVFAEKFDSTFKEVMDAFYQLLEFKGSGLTISNVNVTNSTITMGDITIGGSSRWADEIYTLMKEILTELQTITISGKAKAMIEEQSTLAEKLLNEGKPARRRLRECLSVVSTTLQSAATGNNVLGLIDRIGQMLRLVG